MLLSRMIPFLGRSGCFALALAACAGMGAGTQASAQQGKPGVLLELYTSQGCSACPPAEAMIRDLAARSDVIALALHVDYWDYIGWKDTFAHPAYTARQKDYARANGARHVYTPQMIVGGQDVIVGAKPMKLGEQISAHLAAGPSVALRAERQADRVLIAAPALADDRAGTEPLAVHIVRYRVQADVEITRGENAGRTLRHVNVVTDWQVAAEWAGTAPLNLSVPVEGTDPVVVILQEAGPRAVLAAIRID